MGQRVKNKIAMVTGAATGIGRATAELLAGEGATVIVTDVDATGGETVVKAITDAGGRAEFQKLDVTEDANWKSVMDTILDRHGRLDILVNNAGILILKPITEMSLDEFRKVSRVNAWGVFLGHRHGVAAMRKSGGTGAIINLSSAAGQVGVPGGAAYCATKGAVRLITKAVALEIGEAREQIRVNSVHPGIVRTNMAEDFMGRDIWKPENEAFGISLLKTYAEPRDIAEGILYLASDEGEYAFGTELTIDGGWTTA